MPMNFSSDPAQPDEVSDYKFETAVSHELAEATPADVVTSVWGTVL